MFLSLAFILLSVLVGWEITRQLPMTLRRLEVAAFSVAIGFCLVAWVVFVVVLVTGFAVGLPLSILLIGVGGLLAQFKLASRSVVVSTPYSTRWRPIAWFLAFGTAATVIVLTFNSYQFPAASGAWIANGNVYGDGPLHVALANQLAIGNKLDLISPVYKQSALTYPFLADFYTAILRRLGASWSVAFIVPSTLMILSLLQLVYSLGYRLLRSALGAWLQFLMLVFSGSLRGGIILGWVFLTQGITAYNTKVGTSIAFATGDQYLNFIHSHPLPQRAYLFGLPLFVVVVSIALTLYRSEKPHFTLRTARAAGIIAGILAGIMPLVHVHSFLVLVGALALATAAQLIWRRKLVIGWAWLLGSMAIIATPELIWQTSHSFSGKFTYFISGWMMQNFVPVTNINFFVFWLSQLGILLVMMVFGWIWLRKYCAKPELWLAYAAGCAIFIICNIYAFQPSLWDNMKLFNYGFWFIMIVTAFVFMHWARRPIGAITVAICMISLTTYGFLNLVLTGPRLNFEILSAGDVAFGADMQQKLPQNAYVLVSDRHSHPITMLADRKVLMSYGGWYNLYGADWGEVMTDRGLMLAGDPSTPQLVAKYGLTHAVFSETEVANGEANLDYYSQTYRLVAHEDGWWVFGLETSK